MEFWQVIARESIRDLVARYNANGDTGRFAQVRELFSTDATMDIGNGHLYQGIDEVMTIFTGTKESTGASTALTHVRHSTTTHQIDFSDATHASGRLYFFVVTDIGLDHWGRYVDSYAVVDSDWKFTSRKVSVDGWASNSLFPH